MKPTIRAYIPLADRKRMDFVQGILGKYGLTRWRRQFQSLILRQHPLLPAEPPPEKSSNVVVNQISSHRETHIYHSIYHPVMQTLTLQQSPDRMLNKRPDRIITRTSPVSPSVLPPNSGGDKGDSRLIYSSPHLSEALQERVREHRSTRQQQRTDSYPPLHSSPREPQALKDLEVIRNPGGAGELRQSVLPLKPALADRAAAGNPGAGSSLQLQQHKQPRLRESGIGKTSQQLPAAYHPLQTLRVYSLNTGSDVSSSAQLRLNQKMQAVRSETADSAETTERAEKAEWAGPPLKALKHITNEAVSGSAGTAVGTQQSTPSTVFMPSPGLQSSRGPGLKLALGRRMEAALEHMEATQNVREAQQHKIVAAPKVLPQLKDRTILQLPIPLEQLIPHEPQEPQADVLRHTLAMPNSAARLTEAYRRYANVLMTGRQITADPEPEDHLQLPGRPRSLILRKPEPRAEAPSVPEQPHTEAVFREQAVQPPAHSAVSTKAPAVKLDTAELNQLAERVYQVLEKRIAIRKDRRGLR